MHHILRDLVRWDAFVLWIASASWLRLYFLRGCLPSGLGRSREFGNQFIQLFLFRDLYIKLQFFIDIDLSRFAFDRNSIWAWPYFYLIKFRLREDSSKRLICFSYLIFCLREDFALFWLLFAKVQDLNWHNKSKWVYYV